VLTEKESREEQTKINRREFLKEAGLIVGGATVGSMAILNACNPGTATKTEMVTKTVTITSPGPTITKVEQVAGTSTLELDINGKKYNIVGVKPYHTLAFVLREKCMLPGVKVSCNRGECGSCTVIVDGKNIYSCLMLAVEAAGKKIETVEGLSDGINLNKLQQAFINNRGMQCGFCTPGQLMSATVLLRKNSKPTLAEVQEALSGNLCPCGNMTRITKSVMEGGA
jgi:aerobic-type carbon monoxide dehydrogenase small subunit (CoxS/CutS family)